MKIFTSYELALKASSAIFFNQKEYAPVYIAFGRLLGKKIYLTLTEKEVREHTLKLNQSNHHKFGDTDRSKELWLESKQRKTQYASDSKTAKTIVNYYKAKNKMDNIIKSHNEQKEA